jgi:hypothetical protein
MMNFIRYGLSSHERKDIKVNVLIVSSNVLTLLDNIRTVPLETLFDTFVRTIQVMENLTVEKRAKKYTKCVTRKYVLAPILYVIDLEITKIKLQLVQSIVNGEDRRTTDAEREAILEYQRYRRKIKERFKKFIKL